jgi:hypothetical protein
MKGLSATAIYQDFNQTFGVEAVAYPPVMWYLRAAKCPAQGKEAPDEARVTWTESIDPAILKAVTHNPFPSVRE